MFEKFYCVVLKDKELQKQLHVITDRATFINQVVALGELYGYPFGEAEVKAAMQANQCAWLGRWLR